MASKIFLGGLYGIWGRTSDEIYYNELKTEWRGKGKKVIIAKGNIIEGIEAKE